MTQEDGGRAAAIDLSYHEFLAWVESDVALANTKGLPLASRAFAYAWAAGQVYQANLDATEPTAELPTLRVPRQQLRLLLVASRALLAIAKDVHLDIEESDVADLGATVRIIDRALTEMG